MAARLDGRTADEIRPLTFHRHWLDTVPGSVLIHSGLTRILCTAIVESGVPPFLQGSDEGWVTAEYSMLPGSTGTRRHRDRLRPDGRSIEIQRLIGRALRAIVDRRALSGRTVWIDCDVLQADGGTRTAAINGAYVAMHDVLSDLKGRGELKKWPLTDSIQAISVGVVDDEPRVDLTYYEDSSAQVDMNLIMTGAGKVIEVSGGAEKQAFSVQELSGMIEQGQAALAQVAKAQQAALSQ
jgi:ribonuclease PH